MPPTLCLGTVQQTNMPLKEVLGIAYEVGFRHFDFADAYQHIVPNYFENVSIFCQQVKRETIWITWKTDNMGQEHIQKLLERLGCEYFDTLMTHHHTDDSQIKRLQSFKEQNLTRMIGVSNVYNDEFLKKHREIIQINQIQAQHMDNVSLGQRRAVFRACIDYGFVLMLYAPFSGISQSDSLDYDQFFTLKDYIVPWYRKNFPAPHCIVVGSTGNVETMKNNLDSIFTIRIPESMDQFMKSVHLKNMGSQI